jgi:hypothetical protein
MRPEQRLNLLAEIKQQVEDSIKNLTIEEQVEMLHDVSDLLTDQADELEA